MTFGDRLEELINSLNLSRPEFAKQVGSNKQTIGHIINNKSSPNFSIVHKILVGYPKLSAEWLCRGEGPMWKDGQSMATVSSSMDAPETSTKDGRNWGDVTLRELGEMVEAAKKNNK